MSPPISETAAAGAPGAGDQMQALFEGLDFAGLQSQFFAGPELLGALSADGNKTLRDFLGRLKRSKAEDETLERSFKSKGSDPEAQESKALLHGGPAREPFERKGTALAPSADVMEFMKKVVEDQRLMAETAYAGTVVTQVAKAINELIKGQ